MDKSLTKYRVVASGGVNIRSADTLNAPSLEVYPFDREFEGFNPDGLSWIRITLPDRVEGYVLNEPYLVKEVESQLKTDEPKTDEPKSK